MVANKLQLKWSPKQIAGWLKYMFSSSDKYYVSHETIYHSRYIRAGEALKKELLEHLRRTRTMRRLCYHTQKTDNHGRIKDTVSISESLGSVADWEALGHWEDDLLFGSHNRQIPRLIERQTRYVMLVKIAGRDNQTVIDALIITPCNCRKNFINR